MEAEELRICNYLYYRDKIHLLQVSNIGSNGFETVDENGLLYGSDDILDYNPIPLTEQWLLDFGFKKHDNNRFSKTTKTIAIHVTLTETYPMVMLCDIFASPLSFQSVINFGLICESVHKIQNLHFALTGKELRIKTTSS